MSLTHLPRDPSDPALRDLFGGAWVKIDDTMPTGLIVKIVDPWMVKLSFLTLIRVEVYIKMLRAFPDLAVIRRYKIQNRLPDLDFRPRFADKEELPW